MCIYYPAHCARFDSKLKSAYLFTNKVFLHFLMSNINLPLCLRLLLYFLFQYIYKEVKKECNIRLTSLLFRVCISGMMLKKIKLWHVNMDQDRLRQVLCLSEKEKKRLIFCLEKKSLLTICFGFYCRNLFVIFLRVL